MNPPKGYHIPKSKSLILSKSLYGLKQANRQWYAKLSEALLNWGFSLATFDHSLFVKKDKIGFIALLTYVDDIVVISNNMQQVTSIKDYLHNLYKIKDLGELKYF